MKNYIFYTFLLLFVFQTEAQVGVLTLKKRETPYYGQWFTVKGQRDNMYLIEKEEFADAALFKLLSPYNQTIADGELDKDGDLYWEIDNLNGFYSIIYKIVQEDGDVLLMIRTLENVQDDEEISFWYQKIFR